MATATLSGMEVLTFWELTPREVNISVKSKIEAMKQQQEERLYLTYLNAVWHPNRTKRLPSLDKILNKEKEKKEMSAEEMLNEIKKMNSAMGGTVY